ncbi:hypothetical protein NW759_001235 [Fusarium solani]|nr:hypothetical protein NW759_001235 [Fusarium solani]
MMSLVRYEMQQEKTAQHTIWPCRTKRPKSSPANQMLYSCSEQHPPIRSSRGGLRVMTTGQTVRQRQARAPVPIPSDELLWNSDKAPDLSAFTQRHTTRPTY